MRHYHIWLHFNELRSVFANEVGLPVRPTVLYLHVATLNPSQLIKTGSQLIGEGLTLAIVCDAHKHADPSHSVGLLRARHNGPRHRSRRTNDELAAPHVRH